MTPTIKLLAIVASLAITTSGLADEAKTTSPAQDVAVRPPEASRNVDQLRHDAATEEYVARLAEFRTGRSPANVVLQSNRRLLIASLVIDSPNAALEYDRRASEIEAFAKKNLELGTGTKQEVAQSKSARLDALLKNLLIRSDSRND